MLNTGFKPEPKLLYLQNQLELPQQSTAAVQYDTVWRTLEVFINWNEVIPKSTVCPLKVLGHSVGLCKTTKRKGKLFIILLVDVWRIICENFNPIRLILAEIWMKI